MRLNARTTAYVLTGAVAVAIGGGLATAAFAGTTPRPVVNESSADPIERLPDGSVVVRSTLPVVIEEDTPAEHRADGSILVAPNVPVEVLPGGGIRIGSPS